jgi:hypothetical protein
MSVAFNATLDDRGASAIVGGILFYLRELSL